jgi:hypothetical protein
LGIPSLCATNSGIDTCTQVATSYQYLDDDDGKSSDDELVAVVQFFTFAEVQKIVAMHGASVRARFELNNDKSDDNFQSKYQQAMDWFQSVADIARPGHNMRNYMEDRFRAGDGEQCMNRVEGLVFSAIKASQSAPTQTPAASKKKKKQDPFHAIRCAKIDCLDINFYRSAIAKYANGSHTCLVKEI